MSEQINGTVRRATPEEKELVRLKLGQVKPIQWDTSDWGNREIWVIEHGGIVSGCLVARRIWQLDSLYMFPEFDESAPPVTVRRAVFKLLRAFEGWMRERGFWYYFAHIGRKRMQRNATEYGMIPVYRSGKMFGKEL